MLVEQTIYVRVFQSSKCDDGRRQAAVVGQLVKPTGFACRIAGIPVTLQVNGLANRKRSYVVPKVIGQIAAADWGDVAANKLRRGPLLQPRVRVVLEVPKVLMRIDNGQP